MDNTNKSYYLEQLSQQLSLLIDACHNYDKGMFYQSKNMSAIIRILVKDVENANSKRKSQTVSLLKLLEVKDSMKFYNTGYEAIDPDVAVNLVGIVKVPSPPPLTNQFEHIYIPLLNDSACIDCKTLSFSDWWDSKIIIYKTSERSITFTRKKIVLTMAEQDGGAHIDKFENVDKDYRDISQNIVNIFVYTSINKPESLIKYLQYALVRQISHELIVSILKTFKLNLEYNPTNKINLRGVPKNEIKQFSILAEGDKYLSSRTNSPYKFPKTLSFTTPSVIPKDFRIIF